jgi:hypothetical protein
MKTLYRWQDNKGNASEPMPYDDALLHVALETERRNPTHMPRTSNYLATILPISVTEAEFNLYAR